jgi:adenylate cyclase
MTLSPNYPPYYLSYLGNAYRLLGKTEEAIAALKAYDARSPGFGLTDLVIAYQENGQPNEAKQTAKRLLALRPNFTIETWSKTQSRRDTDRVNADVAALLGAGLLMS